MKKTTKRKVAAKTVAKKTTKKTATPKRQREVKRFKAKNGKTIVVLGK